MTNENVDDDLQMAAGAASTLLEARGASALLALHEEAMLAWLGSFSSPNADHSQNFEDLKCGVPASNATAHLGARIFWRWSRTLHDAICRDGALDQQQRLTMLKALTYPARGSVEIVGGILVAGFGLSLPVAGIVAALAIKFIHATGAADDFLSAPHNARATFSANRAGGLKECVQ